MLTLGWKASAEQFGPHDLLRYGVLAGELGFESAVVSDHFHPWRDSGGHAPFSFAWLGALGASTSRIRMGTRVVTPTFRYHPAIVAQASATLALLFPGRFFLGVGSGEAMNETPVTAGEWPAPGQRARAMADTKEWAALALPAEDKAGVEDPREMERRAKAGEDRAHTRFIVSTDPEEHVAKLREYVSWGFTHLVFHFPGQDQERAMRLYARDILPRLR